jgi:hypothetical protein
MLEFRAEPKTADNVTKIADTLGYPRSDVLLSMVKFALTNHDWARFGLTHKTIPTYKENPTMKPASPAQIAARKRFAEMARSGAFKKATKRKANPASGSNAGKGIYILEYKGFEVNEPYDTGLISNFPILFANQNDAKKAEQRLNDEYGEDIYKSRVRKITAKEAKSWADVGYDLPKPNPAKKTVSQKVSQLVHEGYPQRQAVAVALSEQRAGKVKRNPMMTASQLARVKKELQETERLLAQEIMGHSVQNQDEQLIDFYHKHIAKLKKGLSTGKLESVMRTPIIKRNPMGEIQAYAITRNFKVLGIFQTKQDAIKAAQGISDATGKTLAIKPVQVMAGHFNK